MGLDHLAQAKNDKVIFINADDGHLQTCQCYYNLQIQVEEHKTIGLAATRFLLGFFLNWDRQIINKSSLLCIKQRIFDNVTQSLYTDIENSKKCIFYKYLIDGFHIQHYLRKAIPSKYQKLFQS